MKRKIAALLAVLIMSASLLSGCGYRIGMVSNERKGKMDLSYKTFNDEESHSEKIKEGQTMTLDYSVTVSKGKLSIIVKDPDGEEVLKKEFTESTKDKAEVKAQKTGRYYIYVKGEETSGGCHIKIDIN